MRVALIATVLSLIACPAAAQEADGRWTIAIHGGAGVIERGQLTPEREAEYRAALTAAIEAGSEVLRSGGSALDAVQATDGVPLATPANWVPGEDVIVALSLNDEQARAKYGDLDVKLPYLRFAKKSS